MAETVWTSVRIALHTQPDGTVRAKSRVDFKGVIPEAEAIERTRHILKLDRSYDRGYLLNCLDIGNYEVTTA